MVLTLSTNFFHRTPTCSNSLISRDFRGVVRLAMAVPGVLLSGIPEAARLRTHNNSARIVAREAWRQTDVSTSEVTPVKLFGARHF